MLNVLAVIRIQYRIVSPIFKKYFRLKKKILRISNFVLDSEVLT